MDAIKEAEKLAKKTMEGLIDYIVLGHSPAIAVMATSMVLRRLHEASIFMVKETPEVEKTMRKAIIQDLQNMIKSVEELDLNIPEGELKELRSAGVEEIANAKERNRNSLKVDKKKNIM